MNEESVVFVCFAYFTMREVKRENKQTKHEAQHERKKAQIK